MCVCGYKLLFKLKFRRSVTKFAMPIVSNLSGKVFPVYLFKPQHLLALKRCPLFAQTLFAHILPGKLLQKSASKFVPHVAH